MTDFTAIVVRFPGKPERREELENGLFAVLDQMAQEPDFVNTYANRTMDNSDTIVLYESWA